MIHTVSYMKTYSTKKAAKLAGISWITLRRWLASAKIRPSIGTQMDGRTLWRWTASDVERLKIFKRENYRKGRGRKAKPKR